MNTIKEEILTPVNSNLMYVRLKIDGGYIYSQYDKSNGMMSSVFVPDNSELESLKLENEKLRKCVEWYADERNWHGEYMEQKISMRSSDYEGDNTYGVCGKLARKTLEDIKR